MKAFTTSNMRIFCKPYVGLGTPTNSRAQHTLSTNNHHLLPLVDSQDSALWLVSSCMHVADDHNYNTSILWIVIAYLITNAVSSIEFEQWHPRDPILSKYELELFELTLFFTSGNLSSLFYHCSFASVSLYTYNLRTCV